jgi:hypothetical protein
VLANAANGAIALKLSALANAAVSKFLEVLIIVVVPNTLFIVFLLLLFII